MNDGKIVYRVINKNGDTVELVYNRAYHMESDFNSVESARCSSCHDIYKDKGQYRIAKYRVTYELIEEDFDGAGMEYIKPKTKKELIIEELKELEDRLNKQVNKESKEMIIAEIQLKKFILEEIERMDNLFDSLRSNNNKLKEGESYGNS